VPDTVTDPTEALATSLGSLLRKAAVNAGFDLEPESEGVWWRLRASGAPSVAWVCPLPLDQGALLALPLVAQVSELDLPLLSPLVAGAELEPGLPAGAAGAVVCQSPSALHSSLRRIWTLRVRALARLQAQWASEVAGCCFSPRVHPHRSSRY
jgi:hypothetical protein